MKAYTWKIEMQRWRVTDEDNALMEGLLRMLRRSRISHGLRDTEVSDQQHRYSLQLLYTARILLLKVPKITASFNPFAIPAVFCGAVVYGREGGGNEVNM